MTSKSGFDPSQTTSVQYFIHLGRAYRVCFYGSALEDERIGEKVLFQNEIGKYWLGTIDVDRYMFIGEGAFSTVLNALGYDSDQERIKNFNEVDLQGELPF